MKDGRVVANGAGTSSRLRFFKWITICYVLLVVSAFESLLVYVAQAGERPSVSITQVPHSAEGGPGPTEPISGTVAGGDFASLKIVVYARGGNGVWYVQPTVADPYTDIGSDGKWETDTHLGRSYAALLVQSSFKPPATTDSLQKLSRNVIAVTRVAGRQ
jgi:hypothetical protein